MMTWWNSVCADKRSRQKIKSRDRTHEILLLLAYKNKADPHLNEFIHHWERY